VRRPTAVLGLNYIGLKTAVEALPAPGVLQDLQAAVAYAAKAGKVGIVGYCWGGFVTWMSAARLTGFDCAVCYYGGGMVEAIDEKPLCPVMAHFGERDTGIPVEGVHRFSGAHPEVKVYLYDAEHAFNNPGGYSYHHCAELQITADPKKPIDKGWPAER